MTGVLSVEGLVLRFGGVTALDGVTFGVAAGERLALLGPNGAGKTSVLNCISGVEQPSDGRVVFQGRDLDGAGPRARAAAGIARTLQGLGVVDDLDVASNLLLGCHSQMRAGLVAGALRLPLARREEAAFCRRCEAVATALDLDLDAPARTLPSGARKRLELGRVLAAEGSLLLLDEPFAGTSPDERSRMAAAIRRASDEAGAAVVIVDHHLDAVLALASRAVELDRGRVVAAVR